MKKQQFLNILRSSNIEFKEIGKAIIITYQGSVYLGSVTSLPEGIKFENQGYVYLGSVQFDETNCGRELRSIYIVNGKKYGLRVSLGCWIGTEKEAKTAIRKKYGKSKEADDYIFKVKSAFTKAKIRYRKEEIKQAENVH